MISVYKAFPVRENLQCLKQECDEARHRGWDGTTGQGIGSPDALT